MSYTSELYLKGDLKLDNFIGGAFQPPASNAYLPNEDPSTSIVLNHLALSSEQDAESAISSACDAFEQWKALGYLKRAEWLVKVADAIEKERDHFAILESADTGKPLWLCQKVDIPRAVANFRFFAGAVRHQESKSHLMDDAVNYTQRMPLGVAALITPWNLPLYLLSWKMAPALVMGNCVIAKPSEMTSMTAHRLAVLLQEIEFPKGVANFIFGLGKDAGQPLVASPRVRMVSFTGGTFTGKKVAELCAPLFKKVSLELGGKNASIVFDDCYIDETVEGVVQSAFLNQGQICLCGSRIFVQNGIYESFKLKLVERVSKITVGNPKECWMGSLISKAHREKVMGYAKLALEEGGTFITGGDIPDLEAPFSNGAFFSPSIVEGLSSTSRCATEEIFGPLVTLHRFTTEDEVLGYHNQVEYGLAGSVWSSDVKRAHRVAQNMETGMVWVNCWLHRDLRVPFGGIKASGIGREGGEDSLRAYSESKNICIFMN